MATIPPAQSTASPQVKPTPAVAGSTAPSTNSTPKSSVASAVPQAGASKPAVMTTAKPASNVGAFKIQSIQKSSQYLKILAYGDHGAGKTVLAGSAIDVPEMRDILMINADKGQRSILEDDRIANAHLIDTVSVDTIAAVDQVKNYLIAHCMYRDQNNEEKLWDLQRKVFGEDIEDPDRLRKYRTVIVDTISEVEAMMMTQILGIGETVRLDADLPTSEFQHYKQNNNKLLMFLRILRNQPINVICLAQRSWTQDETKKFHYQPALAGKLSTQVNGYFDVVGYLQIGQASEKSEAPRRLIVQPIDKVAAKNRIASFKGTSFDDPVMADIVGALGAGRAAK